ncbi:hypothetical protein [Enterobacter sp. 22466]|uniref:hypothetical protein n=1 Tax=Enterobacter sp. 22466 TaxID=3453924 RepID=UPI003F8305ED
MTGKRIRHLLWLSPGRVFFCLMMVSVASGVPAVSVLHFSTEDAFLAALALFLMASVPVCLWLHRLSLARQRRQN